MWLFVLVVGLPLIEIALFVTIGAWLGLWLTLAIVIGTAIAGVALLRSRGARAGVELRAALEARRSPGLVLASEALTAIAAICLILPGFLTDTLGLLLLIPPVRSLIVARIAAKARSGMPDASDAGAWETEGGGPLRRRPDAQVIDGTWEELPDPPDSRGGSGWTRH